MDTPNYNETQVSGSSWTRSHHVVIQNPLGAVPTMTFGEERVFVLGEKQITEFAGQGLVVTFDSKNPKHIALYTALNDMYIEARTIRDNPPVVEPPVAPNVVNQP